MNTNEATDVNLQHQLVIDELEAQGTVLALTAAELVRELTRARKENTESRRTNRTQVTQIGDLQNEVGKLKKERDDWKRKWELTQHGEVSPDA